MMKKLDVKLIAIGVLTLIVIGLVVRGPKIKEVEKRFGIAWISGGIPEASLFSIM